MSTPLKEHPRVKQLIANAKAAGARLKGHAQGAKETGLAAGIGFASDYGVELLEEHVAFLSAHYWATPVVMVVGGHLLRKKNNTAGLALAAVGGARLAAGMKAHNAAAPAAQQTQGADAGRAIVKRVFANTGRAALPPPKNTDRAMANAASRVASRAA